MKLVKRTHTANDATLVYARANAKVDLGLTEAPAPGLPVYSQRFRFGENASFDSFFHFHASASEFLYCAKGSIRVWVGDKHFVATASDGELRIPAWTVHRWTTIEEAKETVVYERTEPNDGRKELFFRNIFSNVNDYEGAPPALQIFVIFDELDNIPFIGSQLALPLRRVVRTLVWAVAWVGRWAGYRATYPEYTPDR